MQSPLFLFAVEANSPGFHFLVIHSFLHPDNRFLRQRGKPDQAELKKTSFIGPSTPGEPFQSTRDGGGGGRRNHIAGLEEGASSLVEGVWTLGSFSEMVGFGERWVGAKLEVPAQQS